MSHLDRDSRWYGVSSKWSLLEVARALRKDGKTKQIVELDLKELRSHKIDFVPVSDKILSKAEEVIASTDIFAADAIHICTFREIAKRSRLEGFLCEDQHYKRFREQVPVKSVRDVNIP